MQFLVLATANHSDATSGAKAPSWPILPQDDPRRKRLATSTLSHTDVDEDAETKKAGRVHRSPSRAPPAPRALCRKRQEFACALSACFSASAVN